MPYYVSWRKRCGTPFARVTFSAGGRKSAFLVILVNCPALGVERAFERIQKVVNCAHLQWWGDQLSVTTSVGYATTQPGDTVESMVNRALQSLTPDSPDSAVAASSSEEILKTSQS